MMNANMDWMAAGNEALRRGEWDAARQAFMMVLTEQASAEVQDGLGITLWWLNEVDASHEHRTTAFILFKNQGAIRRAARIAMWLAREHVFLNDNHSAMKGWFARAERLLADIEPGPEHGWLNLLRASMLAGAETLIQVTQQTLQVAQEFKDSSLEILSLAFQGVARVTLGQVNDGMAAIDEAMAAVTGGELDDFMTISEVFCLTLSACEMAGDLPRTEHWCQAASEFARRRACPFLSAYCRTTYGSLLTQMGRWDAAETALREAIHTFEAGHRALRVHAILKLADLRVCQGRLEEAEVLLTGYEDNSAAVVPLARLYLARGEPELARRLLEQATDSAPSPVIQHAPLLALLVDVVLAQGDLAAAREIVARLAHVAVQSRSEFLLAQVDIAQGHIQRVANQPDAIDYYHRALKHLQSYEHCLLAARTRLEMAYLLRETDKTGAVMWAQAACASFERMGAVRDADEAQKLLRELGIPGRSGPRSMGLLTPRETEVLTLISGGLTNPEIAARLFLSVKTVEHHVSQILGKLGVRSRLEAVALATKHGGPDNQGIQ